MNDSSGETVSCWKEGTKLWKECRWAI